VTTKDKTGDQLMASIRKTKTEGAASEKAPGDVPKAAPAARKKAAAKAAPTGAAAKSPPARVAKKKVASKPRAGQTKAQARTKASYQSPGRVWPD
jgi:hypothetical protein